MVELKKRYLIKLQDSYALERKIRLLELDIKLRKHEYTKKGLQAKTSRAGLV